MSDQELSAEEWPFEEHQCSVCGTDCRFCSDEITRLTEQRNKAQREVERLKLLQFSPTGDNHHNAALCPHCNPEFNKQQTAVRELAGALHSVYLNSMDADLRQMAKLTLARYGPKEG